jgi:hypothetical protein
MPLFDNLLIAQATIWPWSLTIVCLTNCTVPLSLLISISSHSLTDSVIAPSTITGFYSTLLFIFIYPELGIFLYLLSPTSFLLSPLSYLLSPISCWRLSLTILSEFSNFILFISLLGLLIICNPFYFIRSIHTWLIIPSVIVFLLIVLIFIV